MGLSPKKYYHKTYLVTKCVVLISVITVTIVTTVTTLTTFKTFSTVTPGRQYCHIVIFYLPLNTLNFIFSQRSKTNRPTNQQTTRLLELLVAAKNYFPSPLKPQLHFFPKLGHWASTVIESRCLSVCLLVCLFVTNQHTLNRKAWRLLVKRRVANIGLQWHYFSCFDDFCV